MAKINIKRLYIMPDVWVTVTHSQVFNWIRLTNIYGISTDCLSLYTSKQTAKNIKQIEDLIKGHFYQLKSRRIIFNDIRLFLWLITYYFKHIFKYDKIIIQTRLNSIGHTFWLIGWFPKVKLVFESRAAINEEKKYVIGNRKKTLKSKIKDKFYEKSEQIMLGKSDMLICVSNALKDFYQKKHGINSSQKTLIIPGAADNELFYYDEELRKNIRRELNLSSELVLIVYSGRLEMKWEIPDKIFLLFDFLSKKFEEYRLLLLTPDSNLADKYVNQFQLMDKVMVKSVELREVNAYLNAADLGMLIREDVLLNNVASPTKFAEYLMSGLPVLLSHSIHDFAMYLHETGHGVVLSGLEKLTSMEIIQLLKVLDLNKNEISKIASKKLSKDIFIDKLIDNLEQL